MSVAVAQYRPDAFNALTNVVDAGQDLKSKGGRDMIHDVFAPIFLKHGMEEKFGLGLLHRHFDMTPSERLVELNNISTPWEETDARIIGGKLLPQSWLFLDNQLVPYEFCYSHEGDSAQEANLASFTAFLTELYGKLRAYNLEKTLGLRVHPGADFEGLVEVTCGRANINFHPSKMSPKNSTETAWFFDPGYIKRGCVCKCNEASSSHNHLGHRTTSKAGK